MKHIKRTKHGLVEKKTGRKIVSPLEPMVCAGLARLLKGDDMERR